MPLALDMCESHLLVTYDFDQSRLPKDPGKEPIEFSIVLCFNSQVASQVASNAFRSFTLVVSFSKLEDFRPKVE